MKAVMHVAGNSLLHRMPAGGKLFGLCIAGTALFFVNDPLIMAVISLTSILAFPANGVPFRLAVQQLRTLLFFIVLIFLAQAWVTSWTVAFAVTLRLVALVMAAALVTYTTPFSAMSDALERVLRPLARWGVSPGAISFSMTLAVRFIPTVQEMLRETQEAQRARGGRANPLHTVSAMVIRIIRFADQVAEALDARGGVTHVDDLGAKERET